MTRTKTKIVLSVLVRAWIWGCKNGFGSFSRVWITTDRVTFIEIQQGNPSATEAKVAENISDNFSDFHQHHPPLLLNHCQTCALYVVTQWWMPRGEVRKQGWLFGHIRIQLPNVASSSFRFSTNSNPSNAVLTAGSLIYSRNQITHKKKQLKI